jgi:hypothetical protein
VQANTQKNARSHVTERDQLRGRSVRQPGPEDDDDIDEGDIHGGPGVDDAGDDPGDDADDDADANTPDPRPRPDVAASTSHYKLPPAWVQHWKHVLKSACKDYCDWPSSTHPAPNPFAQKGFDVLHWGLPAVTMVAPHLDKNYLRRGLPSQPPCPVHGFVAQGKVIQKQWYRKCRRVEGLHADSLMGGTLHSCLLCKAVKDKAKLHLNQVINRHGDPDELAAAENAVKDAKYGFISYSPDVQKHYYEKYPWVKFDIVVFGRYCLTEEYFQAAQPPHTSPFARYITITSFTLTAALAPGDETVH